MTKRVLSLLLAVLTLFALCAPAFAADEPAPAATSGTCGANVKWSLSSDGTLTISGTGPMKDYYPGADGAQPMEFAPWNDFMSEDSLGDNITKIVIKSGVTSVGDYAFFLCFNATSATIPDTVTSIGESAFDSCVLTSYQRHHPQERHLHR